MNKFLQIKEADNLGSPYFYAERLGVNSIAFALIHQDRAARDEPYIGLVNEFKPPIQKNLVTAFGGSLDNPDKVITDVLIDEVLEEAGFKIGKETLVVPCGDYFVSTQMNQICHMFAVGVSDSDFVGRQPQNATEEASEVVWLYPEDYYTANKDLLDWKSYVIISEAMSRIAQESEKSSIIQKETPEIII